MSHGSGEELRKAPCLKDAMRLERELKQAQIEHAWMQISDRVGVLNFKRW